jgi:hypothetical protein
MAGELVETSFVSALLFTDKASGREELLEGVSFILWLARTCKILTVV